MGKNQSQDRWVMVRFNALLENKYSAIYGVDVLIGQMSSGTKCCSISIHDFQWIAVLHTFQSFAWNVDVISRFAS